MFLKQLAKNSLEVLEQRIAPATLAPLNEVGFKQGAVGTPLLLSAGEGLTTGNGAGSGNYLLYVEKGQALVFTTDLNGNSAIDFNEITGIAAGDGLRLISFVDIHGDIVTNLRSNTTLSDSDNNPLNDDPNLKGDGRVLLNSSIEGIELRSVRKDDFRINPLTDTNADGEVDDTYIEQRLVLSSYSIFGNVLAGKSFGVVDGGLIIDTAGKQLQSDLFTPEYTNPDLFFDFQPSIGSIKTGTAASGQYFSFGISSGNDIQGRINTFLPAVGQIGGDIVGVRAANPTATFDINSIEAGNGGVGARGGNIQDVQLNGDRAGGYRVIAGDGGTGPTGGDGGAIINFADFGSFTSRVLIQTGDGGQGTTGAGGAGGNATFGRLNLFAGLNVVLGNGGNGFSVGGNGADLSNAIITTPEGAVPAGVNMIGLATDPNNKMGELASDSIGTHIPVDFNKDGAGDFIYTTNNPSQLVVVFGNPAAVATDPFAWGVDEFGNVIYKRVYLDGPSNAEGLVIGDFNGDGNQDIAAASSTDGSFAGVSVFLSQSEDLNDDGKLSATEDLNSNGTNDFIGFESNRQSVVPSLFTDAVGRDALRRAAVNISDLAAGDFNGDGFTDIALVGTFYRFDATLTQVLMVMVADVENGKPTGQFYADFGLDAAPTRPFTRLGGGTGDVLIEATRLSETADHDVVVLVNQSITYNDQSAMEVYEFLDGAVPVGFSLLGQVDTNRNLPQGQNPNISLQAATARDFTILDYTGIDPITNLPDYIPDGIADLAILTESPQGFIIGMAGDGDGGFTVTTNQVRDDPATPAVNEESQNSGIFFGDRGDQNNGGFGLQTDLVGIRVTDKNEDGDYDEVAILQYGYNGNVIVVHELAFEGGSPNNQGAASPSTFASRFAGDQIRSIIAFDTVIPTVADRTQLPAGTGLKTLVGGIQPILDEGRRLGVDFPELPGLPIPLSENGIRITAGSGGDALVGKGGTGGFIGGGLKLTATATPQGVISADLVGAVSITLPDNDSYRGLIIFTAGQGGNGFSTGGNGGNVTGVSMRYAADHDGTFHTRAMLVGGDGGFGVSGSGGAGGSLTNNSIQSGQFFNAGNGGRGATGGNGGSIIGNGQQNFFDSEYAFITLETGVGGQGVKRGGDGGNVTNFAPRFIGFFGSTGGEYIINAGDGGTAVAGPGGRGGSVINSGPLNGINKLAGEIAVRAGDGGLGVIGGAGGSITKFTNTPSQADNPTILTFIAGNGGAGVSGVGGAGGDLSGITSPSTGLGTSVTGYGFNRFIAGEGGQSAGSKGGAGGSISTLQVSSSTGAVAVVGGAGGRGLSAGGTGGSVTGNSVNAGGTVEGKVLVIAGAGGDAHAFIPNPLDPAPNQAQKAFGGRIGIGGNGGNITGFTQETGIAVRVDLIAGNGGSTVNYGTVADPKSFVGKGGSIINTTVAGNIGNIAFDVPILAYNDTDGDGQLDRSIAEFVREALRIAPEEVLLNPPPLLNDDLGNVGIIVGAAGRIKTVEVSPGVFDSLPATFAVNGSLTGLSARNLMSAVAGDVNRIAAIQIASGLKIGSGTGANFTPGIVGADKEGGPYRDANGDILQEPVLDGGLIDGALVARRITDPLAGRVFIR
ncbi:MAG: Na-Ca exchanger/integrin-beta4 [Chthoniobacter sp.]|jgi:hypothetical protein|nr:Na-Ca exchanger/integrin-beta4 [Chthoniobacter sp.]